MNITLKSFLTTVKRYSTSVVLNIIGLSIAFSTAIVIMMQVGYEYGYDNDLPAKSRTYRVGLVYNDFRIVVFSQPLLDVVISEASHLQYASLYDFGQSVLSEVKYDDGTIEKFPMTVAMVYRDMRNILGLDIIEGDTAVLSTPYNILIPKSLADKISRGESAVGMKLDKYPIGAIYRDRPKNSVIPNNVYFTIPETQKNSPGNSNYALLVTLDSDDPSARQLFEESVNKAVEKYFTENKNDSVIPTIELTALGSELNFCRDFKYDIGGNANKTTIDSLFLIAILIVLIAVINFINFSSALSPLRMKNINMQKVVGARNGLLRRSLVFESVAMALIAYLFSVLIVYVLGTSGFRELVSAEMSLEQNLPLLGWGVAIAAVVGIVAGIYPAYYMTSFPPIMSLKGSFGMSPAGRRYRSILVSVQFVISIVLIITALFINLQNRHVKSIDTGYDREEVLVTYLPGGMYFDVNGAITAEVRSRAEFVDVAYSTARFGYTPTYMSWGRNFKDRDLKFNVLPVTYNFLDVLGIEVVEGRTFNETDKQNFYGAAIFNQSAKQLDSLELDDYFGDIVNENNESGKIVGFVGGDLRTKSLRTPEEPFAFYMWGTKDWGQAFSCVYVRMKANVNVTAAIESLREIIKSADSSWNEDIVLLDDMVNSQYQNEIRQAKLITVFSLVAILISLMGVFGLVLFETQYRRKEIGVRRVFGATADDILLMFNRKFMIIVMICFAVAVPFGYYASSMWLRNFSDRISLYWWVFFVALLIVSVITITTVMVRTLRAAHENPAHSIKSE